jgi:hypothetical protein
MRPLALVLALVLASSTAMYAGDLNQTANQSVDFAKKVALAVKDSKDKSGKLPTSVTVTIGGKQVVVKVQVTPLAEGFSIKAQPAIESKDACPFQTCNIDVNASSANGLTLVSLVGTANDGSDVVAFATSASELAVTVSQGNETVTMNTTTAAADIPAGNAPSTPVASKSNGQTNTNTNGGGGANQTSLLDSGNGGGGDADSSGSLDDALAGVLEISNAPIILADGAQPNQVTVSVETP